MKARIDLLLTSAVLAGLLTALPAGAGDKERVAFEVYAKGYFVKNNAPLKGASAYTVVTDKAGFDRLFGVAFVMGPRPKLIDPKAFDTKLVAVAVKRGNSLWKYDVQKVVRKGDRLEIHYKADQSKPTSATFASPLIVAADRKGITTTVFIENGKQVATVMEAKKAESAPKESF